MQTGCEYTLVATMDYFTKWPEAKALKKNNAVEVAKFLYQNIMTRFGCPNKVVQELTTKHMIIHKKSSMYHPQCNGQA